MTKQLSVGELNNILGILSDAKKKLESDEKEVENDVLLDFLYRTKQKKQDVNFNFFFFFFFQF